MRTIEIIFAVILAIGLLAYILLEVHKPNPYDLNKDGVVDVVDMSIIIGNFSE